MKPASKRPQMSKPLELPQATRSEASQVSRSEEALAAGNAPDGSGTSDLMERALTRANMLAALKRVRRNKGSAGVDRMTIEDLPEQLKKPDSFASQLARMLKARSDMRLFAAKLVDIPNVKSPGLFVLVHELPDQRGLEVTAINFGATPVDEAVPLSNTPASVTVRDVLNPQDTAPRVTADGHLPLQLQPYTGVAFQITG